MARSRRAYDWFGDELDLMVEPPLARRRRLEKSMKDGKKAYEVQRSGDVVILERAAKRLRSANAEQRVLRVPHWDMEIAIEAMRRAGVNGKVTNLCDSRQKRVRRGKD